MLFSVCVSLHIPIFPRALPLSSNDMRHEVSLAPSFGAELVENFSSDFQTLASLLLVPKFSSVLQQPYIKSRIIFALPTIIPLKSKERSTVRQTDRHKVNSQLK